MASTPFTDLELLFPQDSIKHFYVSAPYIDYYVDFMDTLQSIVITVSAHHPSAHEIGHIRTDAFSATTETILGNGICECDEHLVISVSRNVQVIYTGRV